MKELEKGKDKVKKICDILRKETLEPAKEEADLIIEDAKREAAKIIERAKKTAEQLQVEAQENIQRQKTVFQSSLNQASKQALAVLKQKIEDTVFNKELGRLIREKMQNPQVIADLIKAVISGIEKEGIETDLSVYIPSVVPAKEVNDLLTKEFLGKLKEKSVLLGDLEGGVNVRVHNENITLDISDEVLREIVANYTRKDFRETIFQANNP